MTCQPSNAVVVPDGTYHGKPFSYTPGNTPYYVRVEHASKNCVEASIIVFADSVEAAIEVLDEACRFTLREADHGKRTDYARTEKAQRILERDEVIVEAEVLDTTKVVKCSWAFNDTVL